MSAEAILRARGLAFRVEGRTLWRDLDLDLSAGERLAVVGPSGSGKSLLLRTLVGLETPDAGSVSWWGDGLGDVDLPRLRARALYLRQEPAFGEGTVAEALDRIVSFRGAARDLEDDEEARRARVRDLFARLDPEGDHGDLPARDVADLSGGERRLVALVRGLLLKPDVLLLDEPVAGLDRELAQRVLELLADRTWIWVAHHDDQVDADRAVRLGGHGEDWR